MKYNRVLHIGIIIGLLSLSLVLLALAMILKSNSKESRTPIEDTEVVSSEVETAEQETQVVSFTEVESIVVAESIGFDNPTATEDDKAYAEVLIKDELASFNNISHTEFVLDDSTWEFNEDLITVQIKNTDAVILWSSLSPDDVEYPVNKYGSEYPIVYWSNGVPENSEYLYECVYMEYPNISDNVYRTNYVSGTDFELFPTYTGEAIGVYVPEEDT